MEEELLRFLRSVTGISLILIYTFPPYISIPLSSPPQQTRSSSRFLEHNRLIPYSPGWNFFIYIRSTFIPGDARALAIHIHWIGQN